MLRSMRHDMLAEVVGAASQPDAAIEAAPLTRVYRARGKPATLRAMMSTSLLAAAKRSNIRRLSGKQRVYHYYYWAGRDYYRLYERRQITALSRRFASCRASHDLPYAQRQRRRFQLTKVPRTRPFSRAPRDEGRAHLLVDLYRQRRLPSPGYYRPVSIK